MSGGMMRADFRCRGLAIGMNEIQHPHQFFRAARIEIAEVVVGQGIQFQRGADPALVHHVDFRHVSQVDMPAVANLDEHAFSSTN